MVGHYQHRRAANSDAACVKSSMQFGMRKIQAAFSGKKDMLSLMDKKGPGISSRVWAPSNKGQIEA